MHSVSTGLTALLVTYLPLCIASSLVYRVQLPGGEAEYLLGVLFPPWDTVGRTLAVWVVGESDVEAGGHCEHERKHGYVLRLQHSHASQFLQVPASFPHLLDQSLRPGRRPWEEVGRYQRGFGCHQKTNQTRHCRKWLMDDSDRD
ncbi:uncharacterized protein EHS24_000332 [Apiotrichum porosum]|uniref:Secreted protein n=1 Tax=Apiotrichum porosum TaxID=105984 RepID=A0A427Y9W8_9TREE|nr:uncharacterized protein EHS24_000332 [Apiotrichum porosum]RSH87815.1 hypothetical protein EHS24_000332 [Apiotrichum porosum]